MVPRKLRNYGTDFLQFGANVFDIYKNVIPIIEKGVEIVGNNTIIDIASGGEVNAMNIPPALQGFRTQFLSFHHFKPKEAKAIFQNAVDNRQAIGIFEVQQRNIKNFIQRLFSPIAVLLMTPFIKPFKFDRIFFTYLIPIIPLFVLWDGIISVLRTYTETELKQMILEVKNHTFFDWEVGIAKGSSSDVLYLLGIPRK